MRSARLVVPSIFFGTFVAMPAVAQAPPPSAPSELAATLEAYSSFRLQEAGRHLKDRTLSIGHLTVTVNDGTVTPIRARDSSAAGLWITGNGAWTYKAEVASERAVLETNKSRIAPTLPTTADSARDTFRNMIVLFSEPLWADAWDPSQGADGPEESPPPGAAGASKTR